MQIMLHSDSLKIDDVLAQVRDSGEDVAALLLYLAACSSSVKKLHPTT